MHLGRNWELTRVEHQESVTLVGWVVRVGCPYESKKAGIPVIPINITIQGGRRIASNNMRLFSETAISKAA